MIVLRLVAASTPAWWTAAAEASTGWGTASRNGVVAGDRMRQPRGWLAGIWAIRDIWTGAASCCAK